MGAKKMFSLRALGKLSEVLCASLLSLSFLGEAQAALTGSTERIREMLAKHDFPGSEPLMDTQQQFIVFSPDQRLSRGVLDVALKLRQEIYGFFGTTKVWDQPAFVLIFPSKEKYGLIGTGGASIQFKYRGQAVRIIASYVQDALKDKILPHEMVHFLIADLSALGSSREDKPPELPIFLNEGIAEYFIASPGRRLLFEKSVCESLQAGKLEPFKKIVTSASNWAEAIKGTEGSWEQRAQGYSVISFLASLRNGNVKLRNYILSYGTSAGRVPRESASLQAFEMAFRQDYSSYEALQERWVQFIRDREIVTIEGEGASVLDSSGEAWETRSVSKERLRLSGGKGFVFHASKPGSFASLQSVFPPPGVFDVYAIYMQNPGSGQFRLALNVTEFPGVFDGYARAEVLCEPVYYGKCSLGPGVLSARFSVVGKAAISSGFDVGVDCLIFRRDRRLEETNKAAAQKYLQAGAESYRRGHFAQAETSFSAAANLTPWEAAAFEWRAYARVGLGRLDEADQDADEAIKLAPQNPKLAELKKRIGAERKAPK